MAFFFTEKATCFVKGGGAGGLRMLTCLLEASVHDALLAFFARKYCAFRAVLGAVFDVSTNTANMLFLEFSSTHHSL